MRLFQQFLAWIPRFASASRIIRTSQPSRWTPFLQVPSSRW
jgi:hypothetical protein